MTWVRGLLGLLGLLALPVAIPTARYALRGNPLPDTGTDLSALANQLTTPDTDGSLFIGALTRIRRLDWARIALSTVIEAAAQPRGLPTPHLPALGRQQRAAPRRQARPRHDQKTGVSGCLADRLQHRAPASSVRGKRYTREIGIDLGFVKTNGAAQEIQPQAESLLVISKKPDTKKFPCQRNL